jgi:hypothetical protein
MTSETGSTVIFPWLVALSKLISHLETTRSLSLYLAMCEKKFKSRFFMTNQRYHGKSMFDHFLANHIAVRFVKIFFLRGSWIISV